EQSNDLRELYRVRGSTENTRASPKPPRVYAWSDRSGQGCCRGIVPGRLGRSLSLSDGFTRIRREAHARGPLLYWKRYQELPHNGLGSAWSQPGASCCGEASKIDREEGPSVESLLAEIICRDHPSDGQSWLSTNMEIAARCIPCENYVNPSARR